MLGNIVFCNNMIKFCISMSENLLRPSRPWSVTRLWIVERETFNILAMQVQVNPSPLNSSKIAGSISKDGLPRPLLLQEGFPKSTALVFLLSVSASCCLQYQWISPKYSPSLVPKGRICGVISSIKYETLLFFFVVVIYLRSPFVSVLVIGPPGIM